MFQKVAKERDPIINIMERAKGAKDTGRIITRSTMKNIIILLPQITVKAQKEKEVVMMITIMT